MGSVLLARTAFLVSVSFPLALGQWIPQNSGSSASLRGISAVSDTVAWASGTKGTILRTVDGGATWQTLAAPNGAAGLDFRSLQAFDSQSALAMSAGSGRQSRLYSTSDSGATWTLLLQNQDPSGFFDAIAFRDRRNGLLLGDAVDGRLVILRTTDAGATWARVDAGHMPAALPGEGAFAASGTCLVFKPGGQAWIGTGGTGGARVYRSEDDGKTWRAAPSPLRHEDASSGIFSLAFHDGEHGLAAGGNYAKPDEPSGTLAFTTDGGKTWTTRDGLRGYRSAIALIPGTHIVIATGPSGTDLSRNDGLLWTGSAGDGYNAISFARTGSGWAVGAKGAIAKYVLSR